MTRTQIEKLAKKLFDAYYGSADLPFFEDYGPELKRSWRSLVRLAIAEIGALPKRKPRKSKPKSCNIVGGKRVCK
jgi:hypothetical protein